MPISETSASASSIPAMYNAETAFPAVAASARALVNAFQNTADWDVVKGLSANAPAVLAAALKAANALDGIALTAEQLETLESQLPALQRAAGSFSKLTPSVNSDGSNEAAARQLVETVEAVVTAAEAARARPPEVVLAEFKQRFAEFRNPESLRAALLDLKNPAEVGPVVAHLFAESHKLSDIAARGNDAAGPWLYRTLAGPVLRSFSDTLQPALAVALSAGYELLQRRPARSLREIEAFIHANLSPMAKTDPGLRPTAEVQVVHPGEINTLLEARVLAAPVGQRSTVLRNFAAAASQHACTPDVAAAWNNAIARYAPHE